MELFLKTPIEDLLIYKPPVYRDSRGFFMESYNSRHFESQGIVQTFVQDNRSYSKKGTLRGLHLQLGDKAQAKLVGVLSGKVFDVAVDLRPNSKTFGQNYSLVLDAQEDPCFLFIPRGFAHGFLVLSETAEFYYKVDNFYDKESEAGISYDDLDLKIDWPKMDCEFILSEKDKNLPSFKEFIKNFGGRV